MSILTEVGKRIGDAIGATEYGTLLLSAFPDQVLADAHASYKTLKGEERNAVTWIWSYAVKLCKERSIEPYYNQMLLEVKASGYVEGDKLILVPDKESQFRYDDPPVAVRDNVSHLEPPAQKKPIDPNNKFAKMFPVPECIRENDSREG